MPSTESHILDNLRLQFGPNAIDPKYIEKCLREAERSASQLESQIVSLHNEQQKLLVKIDQYRSLLAPIRRIPLEVLLRIFSFCCPENKVAGKMDCPALTLSQVCAGWHELARTTSSLWSRISVDTSTSRHSIKAIGSMIDVHLALSRHHPLHLSLTLVGNARVQREMARTIFHSLAQHSNRWESLSLDVFQDFLRYPEFTSIRHNMPLLKHTQLWPPSNHFVHNGNRSGAPDTFSSAPMLQSVVLGVVDVYIAGGVQLPWTQLEEITLGFHPLITIIKRLTLASAAHTVTIDRGFCPSGSLDSLQDPLLHTMQTLKIVADQAHPNFDIYFRQLTLPHLASLHLSGMKDDYPSTNFSTVEIRSLLTRSGCSLTSLSLVNLRITDITALELLRELRSLSSLTIHEPPLEKVDRTRGSKTRAPKPMITVTDHFLQQLSFDHRISSECHDSHLLPHLRYLSLSIAINPRPKSPLDSTTSFVRMVQSRWIPNPEQAIKMGVDSLKMVELRFADSGAPDGIADIDNVLKPLEMLRSAGLRFEVMRRAAA